MSLIWYPGDRIERFFNTPIKVTDTSKASKIADGFVFIADQRTDGEFTGRHLPDGTYQRYYVQPTEIMLRLWQSQMGKIPFTLEIIPWSDDRLLLLAKGRIPTCFVCLQDPNYTGFRRNDAVEARYWDGLYYPATIVGLNTGDSVPTYRVLFSKLPQIDPDKGRAWSYIDVPLEHVRAPTIKK